jgi:hypothetical protein
MQGCSRGQDYAQWVCDEEQAGVSFEEEAGSSGSG